MKITICGSIACYGALQAWQKKLKECGHEVKLPPHKVAGKDGEEIPVEEYYRIRKGASRDTVWVWSRKQAAMRAHFDKVVWAEAIVVVNEEKNGIPGYVGPNTLIEMGIAMHMQKPIYLVHPIPDVPWSEEIIGMTPIILNNDISFFANASPPLSLAC